MNKLFLLATMILTTNAFAGAVPGVLECESPSGKTQIEVWTDDLGYFVESAKVTIRKKSLEYNNESEAFVQKKEGIFVINLPEYKFSLWSIPKTFKDKSSYNTEEYEFAAYFLGTHPHTGSYSPKIYLNCKFERSN
jgi:hypothetical protein